jgi:hypothetical protein
MHSLEEDRPLHTIRVHSWAGDLFCPALQYSHLPRYHDAVQGTKGKRGQKLPHMDQPGVGVL